MVAFSILGPVQLNSHGNSQHTGEWNALRILAFLKPKATVSRVMKWAVQHATRKIAQELKE